MYKKEAYITMKDHKFNFLNKNTFKLINPSYSDVGKISKNTLERIKQTLHQH